MNNEVTQQEAGRVQGRVQAAMEALMSAQTAAARLVKLGGPDYGERIQQALVPVTALAADITIDIGPVEAHRGLRVPHDNERCTDVDCPIASTREPHTH